MDAKQQCTFDDEAVAVEFFKIVKHRLLDISHLAVLAGSGTSTFQLTNAFGNPAVRLAQERDYIQIDIPGPGPSADKRFF